jgi:hypothetical protein
VHGDVRRDALPSTVALEPVVGGAVDAAAAARAAAAGNEDCGPRAPPIARRGPDPSHRLFAWSVALGLALLVAWLAAVLASAGLSVEVVP